MEDDLELRTDSCDEHIEEIERRLLLGAGLRQPPLIDAGGLLVTTSTEPSSVPQPPLLSLSSLSSPMVRAPAETQSRSDDAAASNGN